MSALASSNGIATTLPLREAGPDAPVARKNGAGATSQSPSVSGNPPPSGWGFSLQGLRPADAAHPLPCTGPADAGAAPVDNQLPLPANLALPVDFYRLWLDPELVTGCAWFRDGHEALAEAQLAGLRRICQLLGLGRGHLLLDAGGGHGAFARLAARECGARVLALARSATELRHMRERLRAERLQARVDVELLAGFTPAPASVDAIVSLNLLAATDFPLPSGDLSAALRPGGRFVGHFINAGLTPNDERSPAAPRLSAASGLTALAIPALVAEQRLCAAGLALAERRHLRPQLAATLEHWRRKLERHLPQAGRMLSAAHLADWRAQLAAAARAARQGRLQLQELVAVKRPDRTRDEPADLSPG